MHNTLPPPILGSSSMAAASYSSHAPAAQAIQKRQRSPDQPDGTTYKKMCAAGSAREAEVRAHMSMLSVDSGVERIDDPAQIAQTVTDARAHVRAQKDRFQSSTNSHVASAAKMLDRTLCLASNFNQGGSTLSSFAPDGTGAGHYIRSFAHDLLISNKSEQKPVTDRVDKGVRQTSGLAANAGVIPNVQSLLLYQMKKLQLGGEPGLTSAAATNRPASSVTSDAALYDASLNYRTETAKFVQAQLATAKHIEVGAYNDYPAVMVHFDARQFLGVSGKEAKALETPAASFSEFLMSHYIGIVNAEAAKMGLNTATVERSSFGHLTPSVAGTVNSFRINLGMMPPAYAEAHAKALHILDQELSGLQTTLAKPFDNQHKARLAQSVHGKALGEASNVLALAFTKAEKTNKTLITHTMRTLNARNFVDSASFHAHANLPAGTTAHDAIASGLNQLFSKVTVSGTGTMNTSASPTSYTMVPANVPAGEAGEGDMAVDNTALEALSTSYASYLHEFSERFADVAPVGKDDSTNQHIRKLAGTLHPDNPDIASALDVANQMLMVHTLDKMAAATSPNTDLGYGSDSDADDDSIQGSKIIVHNGLRSLVGATDSARAIVTRKLTEAADSAAGLLVGPQRDKVGIAYDHPYYETDNAINLNGVDVHDVRKKNASALIVIKDINACVTDAKPDADTRDVATAYPNAKAWIIDTTSATTAQMQGIYQQFKNADNAELLYFASSGLKNEQGGADQNNYGTVRMFAKGADAAASKAIVSEITGAIAATDQGLAQFSHEHRRTMKAMGLAPANGNIVVPVHNDVVMAEAPSAAT